MNRISIGAIAGFVALVSVPCAQGQSSDKSLGEAAREERELHASIKPQKTYNNEDVESPGARWKSREIQTPAVPPQSSTPPPATIAAEGSRTEQLPKRSVLDHRTEEEDADAEGSLVVPVGTELKVEVPAPEFSAEAYTARIVAPVRVSFVTAIPALSTATVQTVARRLPWYSDDDLVGFFEALVVTQVVVEGAAYSVETERVARSWEVRTPSELTFKLVKPLTIQR